MEVWEVLQTIDAITAWCWGTGHDGEEEVQTVSDVSLILKTEEHRFCSDSHHLPAVPLQSPKPID